MRFLFKNNKKPSWSLVLDRAITTNTYVFKCTTERIDFPSCIKSNASLILSKPMVCVTNGASWISLWLLQPFLVIVNDLWHHQKRFLSKYGLLPLERSCRNFLSCTSHTNNDRLSPTTVCTFQCRTHHIGIANTFKWMIYAPTCHLYNHFLNWTIMALGLTKICSPKFLAKVYFSELVSIKAIIRLPAAFRALYNR